MWKRKLEYIERFFKFILIISNKSGLNENQGILTLEFMTLTTAVLPSEIAEAIEV